MVTARKIRVAPLRPRRRPTSISIRRPDSRSSRIAGISARWPKTWAETLPKPVQHDHRELVPYRGRREIIERVVAANADQVVGGHAAGVCPAHCMGPILGDEHQGPISSGFEHVQKRLDKGDGLASAGVWIDHQ